MNKSEAQAALLSALKLEHETALAAAKAATAAATDPDSKAENKYDTRTLEASYIARGQALRVAELEAAVETFESMGERRFTADQSIAAGALIEVQAAAESAHYFMAPVAGGTEAVVDGVLVMVLSPSSPLGQRLQGRRAGDRITLHTGTPATIVTVE
jgi:transcription elongation GreA/GreB family factor